MQEKLTNLPNVIISASLFFIATGIILFIIFRYKRVSKKMVVEHNAKLMAENFNKHLLQAKLEMQEKMYSNLSQEIHDNVGQIMTLAKIQLDTLLFAETGNTSELTKVKETMVHAIKELRDLAKGLNTEYVTKVTLVEAIAEMLSRVDRNGFLTTAFFKAGMEKEIDGNIKVLVFRIIQETIQNTLKHSRATKFEVAIEFKNDELVLNINDNGVGFDKNAIAKEEGLGLRNMISRARSAGGMLTIDSTPGQGTTLELSVPYEQKGMGKPLS